MTVPTVPRVPLPDVEPVPANPDYWDQRAGDLTVGGYAGLVWRDKAVRLRKKSKLPFGFQLARAK